MCFLFKYFGAVAFIIKKEKKIQVSKSVELEKGLYTEVRPIVQHFIFQLLKWIQNRYLEQNNYFRTPNWAKSIYFQVSFEFVCKVYEIFAAHPIFDSAIQYVFKNILWNKWGMKIEMTLYNCFKLIHTNHPVKSSASLLWSDSVFCSASKTLFSNSHSLLYELVSIQIVRKSLFSS